MGKKWYDTLGGTLKAIIGMLILNAGSSGLTGTFRPILAGLRDHFNLTACVTAPYYGQNAVQEAMESIGKSFADTMLLLLIVFIINILLVRFNRITKCRALFTTGHIQVQQAATAIWLMIFALPQLAGDGATVSMPMMIVMSILLGAYWAVGANMTIKPMQELSDGAGFAIAHQQMFGIRLGYFLADKLFGGKDKDGKPKKVKKVGELEMPGLKGTDKVPDTNSYRVFDVHLTCMAFLLPPAGQIGVQLVHGFPLVDGVQVGVNPQRGAYIGMAHLGACLHHIHSGQIQQRAEGMTEPMQGDIGNGPVQPLRPRLAGLLPLQVHVRPGQRRQFSPPEPGQHHNHRHGLGLVRRVPNPLLFFGGQGPAVLLLAAHRRQLHLFRRIGGNDPAHGPLLCPCHYCVFSGASRRLLMDLTTERRNPTSSSSSSTRLLGDRPSIFSSMRECPS